MLKASMMLNLRTSNPVAQGHKRFVFQHPSDPDLLIKVWQPKVIEQRFGNAQPWHKRTRYRQYVALQREISEQLALASRFPGGVPVLQTIVGLTRTDLGVGIVVEKLKGSDGELAPTLNELACKEGITSRLLDRLQQFRSELLYYGVVVGKLHDRNIVLCWRDGEERFVMVDGYGEKTAIPVHNWSRRLNSFHTRSRVDNLIKRLHRHFASTHRHAEA
jgi:hypothetical protein